MKFMRRGIVWSIVLSIPHLSNTLTMEDKYSRPKGSILTPDKKIEVFFTNAISTILSRTGIQDFTLSNVSTLLIRYVYP